LEEDVRIRKYISHRLPNAGISKVEISRTSKKVTITIFTARPGIVIGRGGQEVNRLKKELRQLDFIEHQSIGRLKIYSTTEKFQKYFGIEGDVDILKQKLFNRKRK